LGGGGASAGSLAAERAEPPPTPDLSPPLRGGRGEERSGDEETAEADNSTSVGRNPASVLPAPVGAIRSAERSSWAFASNSNWCSRGDQPRTANHRRKRSGSRSAEGSREALRMRGGTVLEVSRQGGFVEGSEPRKVSPSPRPRQARAPGRRLRCGTMPVPSGRAPARRRRSAPARGSLDRHSAVPRPAPRPRRHGFRP
jgi:hypothetical protein